jgi:D-alanyl-lipoteichoic acid acyltransferase DltB (MBOAT superfamily)
MYDVRCGYIVLRLISCLESPVNFVAMIEAAILTAKKKFWPLWRMSLSKWVLSLLDSLRD